MKALINHINRINLKRSLFGADPLDLTYNIVEVREALEAMGDPAALSADGEYSRAETERRTNEWLDAITQLNEYEKEIA